MANIGERAENLPDNEKSHAYAVRLHPAIGKEKIAIDYLEAELQKGKKMRKIIVELILSKQRLGKADDVEIKAVDAKKIMGLLKDILGRVKSGLVVQNTPASHAAAEALDHVTDDHFDQFDRFLSMGVEDSESDFQYYDDED